MKVIAEFPPNIGEIRKHFDLTGLKPVFTYGDTLYNPNGGEISDDLMAHEEVHEKQQAALGVGMWWDMYLSDPGFRLKQEVEAYKAQYQSLKDWPRQYRRALLRGLAHDLSSKLYGKIIKQSQAKELIHG